MANTTQHFSWRLLICVPWYSELSKLPIFCIWISTHTNWFSNIVNLIGECRNYLNIPTKGQLISKRLFGILEFFQKTHERIRHSTVRRKKPEFVRSFFWKNRRLERKIRLCLTFIYRFCQLIMLIVKVDSYLNHSWSNKIALFNREFDALPTNFSWS